MKTENNFNHFRAIIDSLESVVYVTDVNTYEVLFANKYAKKIFGEIEGETCWKVLQNNQDGPCSFCTNDKIINPDGTPGKPCEWDNHDTENGSWYHNFDCAINWINGRLVKLGIATDISGLKYKERLSQETIRFYEKIVSSANEGIIFYGRQLHYMVWNRFMEEMTGLPASEVLGKKPFELFPHLKEQGIDKLLQRALSGETVVSHDIPFHVPQTGKSGWYYGSYGPYLDINEEIAGVIGIIHDITERKKTEKLLAEAKDFNEKLITKSAIGILTYRQDGQCVLANDAAAEITGATKEKLLSQNFHSIEPWEKAGLLPLAKQTIETGIENRREFNLTTTFGKEVWFDCFFSRFISNDEYYLLLTIDNLTEYKKLEADAARAQKLESVGILAGGIAHDFNNLLTGILGYINLAKKYSKSNEKTEHLLEEAEKASLRTRDLTHQLLTFSKGGAPVKRIFPLKNIITDSAAFTLRGSNVKCEFSIPDGLPNIEADESQINQVINNIVFNAAQSMPGGGTINIRAEAASIRQNSHLPLKDGTYAMISIEDYGTGISKEHIDKIFDPYFTTKQKGSGLGLAITYSIIKNHGGHITVKSEPGKGSAFTVYLPASSGEAAVTDEDTGKPNAEGAKYKILIMDDEEIVRNVAGDMLKSLGHDAAFAKEGAEAIESYKKAMEEKNPFNAVIMDLTIPGGIGGKEAIQKLLKIDPNAKAIVSSGYSDDPVMADFKKYGFAGVINKPYRMDELKEGINKILTSKS